MISGRAAPRRPVSGREARCQDTQLHAGAGRIREKPGNRGHHRCRDSCVNDKHCRVQTSQEASGRDLLSALGCENGRPEVREYPPKAASISSKHALRRSTKGWREGMRRMACVISERGGRTHDRADMSRLLCQLSYLAMQRDRRWPVVTAHVLYRARAPFVKGKHAADQPWPIQISAAGRKSRR